MGYWGYFVVGRSVRPLTETEALAGVADELRPRTSAPDGWQVWEYPSADGDVGSMNTLARETGAPALFGYVMDGACVVVEAAAPESGAWTTCLARAATACYLGAGDAGLTLEDYFLPPDEASARAVAWAAEAGREADPSALLEVLTADGDEMAENLLFRLLDRLGVVPL
ncbi:hypothetical protein [Streptomyces griseosporeus]|uniref:hypothetical protein n=1 Tax=Streptomyces griseosporeus TaxID=1910 RepID=UPI0036FED2F1